MVGVLLFCRGYDNRRDDSRNGPSDRRDVLRRDNPPRDRDDRAGRPDDRYNK